MMPTLLDGDFILVNKYDYGIRLPVLDTKIIDIGTPKRGDVVVFRYPVDPAIPFIKRIVGLPGDTVEYRNKTLYLNGQEVVQTKLNTYLGTGSGSDATGSIHLREALPDADRSVLSRLAVSLRHASPRNARSGLRSRSQKLADRD